MNRITTAAAAIGSAALAAGLGLAVVTPAQAAYNVGVKSLTVGPASDWCDDATGLTCTDGAGQGAANVLRVTQSVQDDGELAFDAMAGTSAAGEDHLWMAAEFAAECRTGYSLYHGHIGARYGFDDALINAIPLDDLVVVPVPDAKSMSSTLVAVDVPLDNALNANAGSLIAAFPSADWVYAYGESVVADRISDGQTPAAARAASFSTYTTVELSGLVMCRGNGLLERMYYKTVDFTVPLHVQYEGEQVHQRPTGPSGLEANPAVTDVDLTVEQAPGDSCSLTLVGDIETSAPLTVDYRFLNPYGQPSNTYSVQVGADGQATVEHHTAVPGQDGPDPTGDLLGVGETSDLDQEGAASDDGSWSGTFTLEVLSPNPMSDVDAFRVDWCVDTTDVTEDRPTGLAGTEEEPVLPVDPTPSDDVVAPTGEPTATPTRTASDELAVDPTEEPTPRPTRTASGELVAPTEAPTPSPTATIGLLLP
jgi:hypothetical protein